MDNTQDILTDFELYTGGQLSISSTEELALCQKVYDRILATHDFEFLKKEHSGVLSMTEPYVAQPEDFSHFTGRKEIYIGAGASSFRIIPFDDRRNYEGVEGVAYLDARQERITFTKQPTAAFNYSFDYIYVPPALDLAGSDPVFPKRFWPAIKHGMLIENDTIEMSEKARAFMDENAALARNHLNALIAWNGKISGYDTLGV